jgi:hypothetical protein
VQLLQTSPVLLDVPLSDFAVQWPSDAFDEPCLEELLQDLEDFLQDVLLVRLVVASLLAQVGGLLLVLFHSINY